MLYADITQEQMDTYRDHVNIRGFGSCWVGSRRSASGDQAPEYTDLRLVYVLSRQEDVPDDVEVYRKCDTEGCFNPDCLFLGDESDVEPIDTAETEGDQKFACPECDKEYVREASLRSHIESKHEDEPTGQE